MWEENITPDQELENQNIFEDFSADDGLGEEIQKHEEKKEKNAFFYIKKATIVLNSLNALMFLVLGVFFVYIMIQQSDAPRSYNMFKPICNVFLWDSAESTDSCYSVTYYLKENESQIASEKLIQSQKIGDMIGDIYLVDNFIYSKVVTFLITSSKNRLKPVEIMSAFDALKNTYEPIDKSKITCENISISSPWVFEARCEAYSSDWDSEVPTLENGILTSSDGWGTAVSVASSFIDYIENAPESDFSVVDKQKVFYTTSVTGKWIYTKKTPFTLLLRYEGGETIDF